MALFAVATEPRVIQVTLPMPPNLANGRMHHMVKHQVKVGYWAVLDMQFLGRANMRALEKLSAICDREQRKDSTLGRELFAILEKFSRAPLPLNQRPLTSSSPIKRASIRSTMHLGAAMDDGNAMNRHKWIEDWFVTRGFLADDRRKCLQWERLPTQVVKRDGNYRIDITITETLG